LKLPRIPATAKSCKGLWQIWTRNLPDWSKPTVYPADWRPDV
jgi:hypothetical protein